MPRLALGGDAPWAISLGRYLLGPEQFGERQAYSGERNLLLFGPNGSGKGTRFLMPNLLQMTDCSMVVIDPKGELEASNYCAFSVGKGSVLAAWGMERSRSGGGYEAALADQRRGSG